MKKILVTGSQGQLGNSIKKIAVRYNDFEMIYTDVAELDITNVDALDEFLNNGAFTHIVNCAAYTAVDKAEDDFEMAKKINALGPKLLAQSAAKHDVFLIHISTDYVYDGKAYEPYIEAKICAPPSAYGKSKLLGEEWVRQHAKEALVIRTSWLYSEFGHNFLKTMLKYGREKEELKVVFDQIGSPTYATDLAEAILQIIKSEKTTEKIESYHYSNEGVASWYDFAQEIMIATAIDCKVTPIQTFEYPLPAPRPFYSVLNKAKIKKEFDLEIPHWRASMMDCLKTLGEI